MIAENLPLFSNGIQASKHGRPRWHEMDDGLDATILWNILKRNQFIEAPSKRFKLLALLMALY